MLTITFTQESEMEDGSDMRMGYGRFAAMVATSTVVMYGLMYLNTYVLSHVEFSQTRAWMAIVMGAAMAFIMLGFMTSMYKSKRANMAIFLGSVVVFAIALWLVRSQETVDDVSYMKAMVPHHSIAIMTSERAHIKDPEVRKLADGIIDAQIREITQMKRHIARLEAQRVPNGAPDLPSYRDRHVPPPPPETDESTGIDTLQPIR
ncbi:hypothetical protein GCM10007320_38480 [Pseudorhodoferax aquiterrae]|uniref:DUF305 domain-containing protein n=3 Tax=Comamonadaceae TaxID=80864 RepID=A0AAE3NBB1_9BURK|nr:MULTISPECIES: DUF305 domain-containing protein [Comamonadaceae]MDA7418063.1 DUF305 domain-containing protein [Xenophilus arseniciresistens]GHC90301.1 hypothetical protein GCM10007320_38480 [Pseudorhodoferax aquiterrae]